MGEGAPLVTRVSFPWCPPAQLARALGISLSELAEASAGMPRRFALLDDAEIDTVCEHLGRRRPEAIASAHTPPAKLAPAAPTPPQRDARPLRARLFD